MSFAIKTLATFFGLGLVPYISGTAGSLGAIPIFIFLARLPWPLYFLTTLTLTLLAIWISALALPLFQDPQKPSDPCHIVIDEVVGFLWALGIVRYAGFWDPKEGLFWLLALGFVFFRFFDITKLGWVGWSERKWPGAVGVVMDDVFAGLFAGLASILFCILYPLVVYLFA